MKKMKKQINIILTERFPKEKAICVLTRVDFDYIKKISASMAWKMKYEKAITYDKLIIVSLGSKRTVRGEIMSVDIKNIFTLKEIKEIYRKKQTTADIDNLIIHEKSLPEEIDAIFSEKNLAVDKKDDEKRHVIIFDINSVKGFVLDEDFKGLSNPVFYIDKHFTQKQLEDLDISKLKISNLLNFNDINIDFAKGINLFIGENNVGKTGLLKFLYANIKSYEEYNKLKNSPSERSFKELLSIKLQNTFQSDDKIGSIVCKSNNKDLNSDLTVNNYDRIQFSFKKTTKFEVSNLEFPEISKKSLLSKRFNTVFIPAKEVLSISKIIELAKDRYSMPGFDDTYNDLIDDIEPHFVKRHETKNLENISNKFKNNIIDGEIEYDFDKSKYYYQGTDGYKYDLTMTAEGVKQLGIIPLLIKTGKIKKGTILFLDEPDNNLNPVAIRKFVYALFDLASAGVQIFITTHSHLFSQYISLLNEYKSVSENINIPDSKFFALFKDKNKKTSIEIGNDLLDIQNNLILDEHVKLSDKEQEFISKSENL